MIKWIAIIIFALIGLLDVLLILGSAELERRRKKEVKTIIIPRGEWIPCSERLPEEEGNYLVTFGAFAETINGEEVIFGDIDGSVSEIGYGCYERDVFWNPTAFGWYDLATATPFDKRAIIAWMPLPEPWKGADDE